MQRPVHTRSCRPALHRMQGKCVLSVCARVVLSLWKAACARTRATLDCRPLLSNSPSPAFSVPPHFCSLPSTLNDLRTFITVVTDRNTHSAAQEAYLSHINDTARAQWKLLGFFLINRAFLLTHDSSCSNPISHCPISSALSTHRSSSQEGSKNQRSCTELFNFLLSFSASTVGS